ncbi:MAG: putative immunity protein [Bacteroidota bacterium]
MENKKLKKISEQSKRYQFIAEHRGGPLTKENHRKLMNWARECAEHALSLIDEKIDEKLIYSLDVAREWENDNVPTGVAMKASLGAHEVARQSENQVSKEIARAIGQAVATAHMSDHSLGGAFYALKAVKLANKNVDEERYWQIKQLNNLPSDIINVVQSVWKKKELDRRI